MPLFPDLQRNFEVANSYSNVNRFHWFHNFFPAYFSVIFYMFCIIRVYKKINREPKFGSDRTFDGWFIRKLKCQIFAWLTGGAMLVDHFGTPTWRPKNLNPKQSRILIKMIRFKLKMAWISVLEINQENSFPHLLKTMLMSALTKLEIPEL